MLGHKFSSTPQRISFLVTQHGKHNLLVSYAVSACICCDVITSCIHSSQKCHLCMRLAYTASYTAGTVTHECFSFFFLNMWHYQVTLPLPDNVGVMEIGRCPQPLFCLQILQSLTPFSLLLLSGCCPLTFHCQKYNVVFCSGYERYLPIHHRIFT